MDERALLVAGVGNAACGDDALGLVVAERLRARVGAGVRVLALARGGFELIDAWRGVRAAIVVDAARSGAPPGTLLRFDARAGPLPARSFAASTHGLSIADAIELGRALDELPARLVVLAVEGKTFDPGAALSSELDAAASSAVERVLAELALLEERVCTS